MADRETDIRNRLQELARIQKQRHLTERELWECSDLLRAMGREVAAREAESAALRQRARETLRSPDATFSVREEASDISPDRADSDNGQDASADSGA